MSDEAVQAARWLLDFLVPAGSHIGPVDEKALVVARALLSREAQRDAMRREIDDLRDFIRGVGINFLRAAGQPSADGGKEGK